MFQILYCRIHGDEDFNRIEVYKCNAKLLNWLLGGCDLLFIHFRIFLTVIERNNWSRKIIISAGIPGDETRSIEEYIPWLKITTNALIINSDFLLEIFWENLICWKGELSKNSFFYIFYYNFLRIIFKITITINSMRVKNNKIV